jgi:Xaa-Pro aminopeptidase
MSRFEGGVVVVAAAPAALRNADVEHPYRQESDLHYLSGFDEPESVLVLASAHPKHHVVFFVRPRDPERETWDGPRAGVEGTVEAFGADAAYPISELTTRLPEYLSGHGRLLFRFGRDRAMDERVVTAIGGARSRARLGAAWPTEIADPAAWLHEMRLVKSKDELSTMRRAGAITRRAHVAAMRATSPGRYEYEIEAVLSRVFCEEGAQRPAYESIVGSGHNATVLHYRSNRRRMQDGDLVLVDAACELDYYASDVTRTWPVSGRFTVEQKRVYEIVLAAQLAAIAAVKPGATLDEVHLEAVRVIVDGLVDLGILSGAKDELIAGEKHKPYYMHRTSHWLGMDVHDVGLYSRGGKPRPLEPGMVLTVEPGLYLGGADETVPEGLRGMGVRIEDDIAVTADGCENLTADVPKTPDEVERTIRGG